MEVILKEDVPKLGSRGDVVKVAEGFGRNYLLPQKLAIEASAGNKKVIEQMKAAAVRRSAKEKTQRRRSWPSSSRAYRFLSSAVLANTTSSLARSPRATSPMRWPRRVWTSTAGRFRSTSR